MVSARCRLVRLRLGETEPGAMVPRVERHVATCLRCQAERVRARRTHRELAALSTREAAAPPGFVASVAAAIDVEHRTVERSPHSRRGALAGAAALAAGGAALAAWRLVRRPA